MPRIGLLGRSLHLAEPTATPTPTPLDGQAELAPFALTRYYTCPYLGATSASSAWATGTARMHVIPVHETMTIDRVGAFCGAAVNRSIRFGIYTLDSAMNILALLLDVGTFTGAGAAVTFNEFTISQVLAAGWYGLAFAMFGTGVNTTFSIQGNNQQYGPLGCDGTPSAGTESQVVGWTANIASPGWTAALPTVGDWTPATGALANIGSGVWLRRSA